MALIVQNLRAVGTGVEPNSLLPGQVAFNVTDKIIYVGDGSNFKTNFDGTQVAGVTGNGWYSMPMDFDSLGDYYVANPGYYGDVPTDQQVLAWSTALNHPIWITGTGGGGSQVYVVTNAQVAAAPGATTSDKITAAIGVASPDEGNVTIVTGLPDDVYEGLYFYTTEWVKGASYAYPSASEVIYDNTAHPSLTATVQGAIDDLDDGLAATTAIANTANSTANSALSIASAALPRAGGTMTGTIVSRNIDVQSGFGVQFNAGANGTINGINDSVNAPSSTVAASSTAVKAAYDLADAALSRTGGTMTGNITFQDAGEGVVFSDASSVYAISDNTATTSSTTAASSTAVKSAYDLANAALSRSGGTMTGNITFQDPGEGVIFNGGSQVFAISDSTSTTSSTTAASSTAVKSAYDLANAAVPRSSYASGGDILVGTGAGTFGPLLVGTDGQVLTVVSGVPAWTDDVPGDVTSVTGAAPITVNNADPENPVVGVNLATTATPGVVQIELTGNLTLLGGVINVPDASTTVKGAVQLNNTLGSSSTTQALTAAQGAALQSQINALTLSNSVILAGGYDASTGLVDGVTSQGTLAGFAEGVAPPAAAAGNVDHYLICVVAGSNPSVMQNGDWLLSVETSPGVYAYQVLGVGARPDSATYTQEGIVQLANAAAVLAGTSDTLAITPQALQDNVLDSVTTANSSQIASSTAVKTAYDAGVQGQTDAAAAQATANAALPKAGGTMTGTISSHDINIQNTFALQFAGGVNGSLNAVTDLTNVTSSTTAASATAVKAAYDIGAAAIPCATITAVGDIVVGGAGPAPTALPVGTDGQVLVANSACAAGLEWVTDVPGDVTGVNATFPITVDNTDPQQPTIGINGASTVAAGAVQLSDSVSSTSSLEASTPFATKTAYDLAAAAVPCSSFLAKGNILGGTAAGAYSALTVGTNGQFLSANSACGTGLEWCTLSLACVPCSAYTAVGTILAGNGAGTYCSLAVGANGQVLVPNSACAAGVEWITCQGVAICGYSCTATPFNTAIGANAGDSITTGVNNTVFGYNSGTAITGGLNNTFIGFSAGDGITTSDNSVAVGSNALGNTGGNNNTAVGYCTGGCLTSGGQNTFIGGIAGYRATTLDNAVAVGYGAMGGITTGTGQVAVGSNALAALTSGAGNVAVGYQTLDLVTTGANNTAVGHQAGSNVATTVSGNTLVGFQSGTAVTTGGQNTLVGNGAGSAITTGANNTILGNYTGTTALANNVVLSDGAGNRRFQANSSGAWSYDGTNFGTAGQFLTSQGSAATPVWCTLSLACIPCSAFTAAGQLLAGTGSSTFTALSVGTNGQFLAANNACSTGVQWCTLSLACVPCSAFTAPGQLLVGTGSSTFSALTVGTNGQFLIADSGAPTGLSYTNAVDGGTY